MLAGFIIAFTIINNLNNLELLGIYNNLKEKYSMLGLFEPYRFEDNLSKLDKVQ